MLENVRIDDAEKKALLYAIDAVTDEVYLFGSRLDMNKRGGDIDMLIYSNKNSLRLSQKVARKFFMMCEENIDVLVFNKNTLIDEQKSFINTLRLMRIK